MDDGQRSAIARLLSGQYSPPDNSGPLSKLLMNETIVPSQPGNEYRVRSRLATTPESGNALMAEMLMPDRGMSMMDRFMSVSTPAGALGVAGNLLGGPSLAMFAGPMAQTANKVALAAAQRMAASKAAPEQIWKETGWFQGADGKWRFEIPDTGLKVNQGQGSGVGALSPVSHPELAQAYPQLANMKVDVRPITPTDTAVGSYRPGLTRSSLKVNEGELYPPRETAVHELQHAIQNIEGFARGGNTSWGGRDAYRRSAGEVEARNVEGRLGMSERERQQAPPWQTQTVPNEQQIVNTPGFFDRYGLPLSLAGTGYATYNLIDALRGK